MSATASQKLSRTKASLQHKEDGRGIYPRRAERSSSWVSGADAKIVRFPTCGRTRIVEGTFAARMRWCAALQVSTLQTTLFTTGPFHIGDQHCISNIQILLTSSDLSMFVRSRQSQAAQPSSKSASSPHQGPASPPTPTSDYSSTSPASTPEPASRRHS